MTVCQSNPAVRTSCSSSSCAASVIWHALATPPAAAAPAADLGEKRVKITTVLERVVIGDQAFRAEELEEPAVLVLARGNRMCVRRDGYAEVCGSSGTARTIGGSAAAARPAVGRQSRRQHHVGTDGTLTTNRGGRTLCQIWQEGQCDPSVRVANARVTEALCTIVPAACRLAHGAKFPQPCTPPVVQPPKGKGRCKHEGKTGRQTR